MRGEAVVTNYTAITLIQTRNSMVGETVYRHQHVCSVISAALVSVRKTMEYPYWLQARYITQSYAVTHYSGHAAKSARYVCSPCGFLLNIRIRTLLLQLAQYRHVQYRHLIPAPVDRTSDSDWL